MLGFTPKTTRPLNPHAQRSIFEIAQGAHQQPSAHQQHHAQCHLQSNDDLAGARFAGIRIRCRRGCLQCQRRPGGERNPQRRQPEQKRSQRQNAQREKQDGVVRRQARLDLRPGAQRLGCRVGKDPCQHAAGRHQQQALAEQLPEQLLAPCAQRQPHRELALPRRISRHQQHDHVAQRDQQHEPHHAHQHSQRLAVLFFVAREALGLLQAECGPLLSGLRIAQPDIGRRLKCRLKLRDRLRLVYARRETSNQPQAPPCGIGDVCFPILRGLPQAFSSARLCNGIQKSVEPPASTPSKPCAATPTMVIGTPFT